MKKPKISVLIPAFNEEKMLEEAVQNVLKSRYPNKEIIIGVDDGTDKTYDIAKRLKKRYSIVNYVYHPKRVGTTANMNSILRKAKGEIVLKFDADMRIGNPKNFFFNIAKHFKNERVGGIAIFGYNVKDRKLRQRIESIVNKSWTSRGEYVVYRLVDMMKNNMLPLSKIPEFPIDIQCFRRKLVKKLDPRYIHDDAVFAYKVLEKGYAIESATDVAIAHLGTPMTTKGLFNTRVKGKIGWKKFSNKYKINFNSYYFRLISLFFRNITKFSIKDILAFFYWSFIFSISLLVSCFRKEIKSTSVWKERK